MDNNYNNEEIQNNSYIEYQAPVEPTPVEPTPVEKAPIAPYVQV